MIKRLVLLILLSLSSLAALAVPSVTEVEGTISSGDYAKAKSQIKEVLKVHPDSVVANKYMLEIIKIEYAGSLQPSVEFKIYEDKLKQIAVEKAKRLEAERIAKEKKEKEEFWLGVRIFFKNLFIVLAIISALAIGGIYFTKHRKKVEEQKRKQEWVKQAKSKFLHIHGIFERALEKGEEEFTQGYRYSQWRDLLLLDKDNKEAMEAVDNNDYEERMINDHFKDAYSFIDKVGLE